MKRSTRHHLVLVPEPHLQSLAALALLTRKYDMQVMIDRAKFRYKFLKKFKTLTCIHCGKTDLRRKTTDQTILATVDHIVPLSQGGSETDEANCLVSCWRCNHVRADSDLEEFRKSRYLQQKRLSVIATFNAAREQKKSA